ncbi:MAG: penicillin-binding protein 2 [Kiritimatiellae bacterium]|nr:penicillin-binding protein 2 [Kiritimatiellia bacterium]
MMTFRRHWRILLIACVIGAAFTGLGVRLAFLHLGDNEALLDRINRTRHLEQTIVAGRGRVLDRNGVPLAMDLAVKNICVDPKVISEKGFVPFVGRNLARVLQEDPEVVLDRLNRPDRRFEYVRKFAPSEVSEPVAKMQLPGVFFEETTKRYYPQNSLMCHVVGFSNMEGVGSAGIEQRLNGYLRSTPGLRVGERDGRHREIYGRRSLEIDPLEGADVFLTLDMTIQHLLEKSMTQAMEQHQAKGAWAIVQRVRTGEILAMASYPNYDLNEYSKSTPEQRRNRNIGYVYEPGSTFKVAVIAAALNEGLVAPEDIIDCENGHWFYGNRPLRDFHAYGKLSVADVIKKSSNIGAAKVAVKLGPKALQRYLHEFGIGRRTGVDLPGEESGILHPTEKWSAISITRIAMGHEVAVTALQMLNVMSAIANDGFLMRPLILSRVQDSGGRTIFQAEPEVRGRPIREETSHTMKEILAHVTEKGGTGTKAAFEGYRVAGKTGTAQKPVRGGYSDSANIASFVGFFPVENPEVAMIVVVDEPQPLHTGGQVSAPVFSAIGGQVARYLGTRPGEWSGLMDGMMANRATSRRDELDFANVLTD